MYAIIRTGGKQAKVQEGDVLDVERLHAEEEVEFTPLLIVNDDGTVISGRSELASAKVVAKIIGGSMGPKVDIFKYKSKTGYRRRQGHRQKYTQIEIIKIEGPGTKPEAKKASSAKSEQSEKKPAPEPAATADAGAEEKES